MWLLYELSEKVYVGFCYTKGTTVLTFMNMMVHNLTTEYMYKKVKSGLLAIQKQNKANHCFVF